MIQLSSVKISNLLSKIMKKQPKKLKLYQKLRNLEKKKRMMMKKEKLGKMVGLLLELV